MTLARTVELHNSNESHLQAALDILINVSCSLCPTPNPGGRRSPKPHDIFHINYVLGRRCDVLVARKFLRTRHTHDNTRKLSWLHESRSARRAAARCYRVYRVLVDTRYSRIACTRGCVHVYTRARAPSVAAVAPQLRMHHDAGGVQHANPAHVQKIIPIRYPTEYCRYGYNSY